MMNSIDVLCIMQNVLVEILRFQNLDNQSLQRMLQTAHVQNSDLENRISSLKRKKRYLLTEFQIRFAVEIFKASDYSLSDVEIANLLKSAREVSPNVPVMSSSTIGRKLIDSRIAEYYGIDEYREILKKRRENLIKGKSKGGKAYAEKNIATRDGRLFTGSRPR